LLSRLLYVPADLLRRSWPFFAVYFALFAALTLLDGLSLTLFVQRVGVASLPAYQAVSALCVIGMVCGYVLLVDRFRPGSMFLAILLPPALLLLLVWLLAQSSLAGNASYGLLFVGRDLAFALVLLHFGTFLQDYFCREELNGVMPLIYAGGRVGGIAAGAALQYLSGPVRPVDLLPVTAGVLVCATVGIGWICLRLAPSRDARSEGSDSPGMVPAEEQEAVASARGFVSFLLSNRLMFWITLSTVAYFICKTCLAFRYNECFEQTFASEAEMAAFLGVYTKYALAGSLLLQLFFVNRWIALVGLKGAHLTYAGLLVAAATLGSVEMTLACAVFVRLIEGELRFCLRNPVAQMTVNLFSKPLRIRARAWSMGLLIPASTFAAAVVLSLCVHVGLVALAGPLALCFAVGYLAATGRLVRFVRGRKRIGTEVDELTSRPQKKRLAVHGPAFVPAPNRTRMFGDGVRQ